MSWRERIRPAKFRATEFYVESSDFKTGRRGPVHEFPQKAIPWREDMGRKARVWTVEGYVLGEEYLTAKDALITELEKEGPGELVHPYYGTVRVAVGDVTVRETRADGGIARFSIEFLETTPEAPQPAVAINAVSKLTDAAAGATAAVGDDFLSRFNPGTLMSSVSDALINASAAIKAVLPSLPFDAQTIAALRARVDAFADNVGTLIGAPADLLNELVDLFGDLAGATDSGVPVPPSALLQVYSFDPGVRPPATTDNRAQEQANFDAAHLLVQRLALIQAATLAPLQTFDSYEDAVSSREEITELLDEQAETAADDTFPVMLQLRADLTTAVPGEASDLPRLVPYTPPSQAPSLVLLHRLYGNLDLEADLLARNGVKHPGFIRGGVELEVLSDG